MTNVDYCVSPATTFGIQEYLAIGIMISGILLFIVLLYEWFNEMEAAFYLKKFHHERWNWLSSVRLFGIESDPVVNNSIRALRYWYSDLDNEDEIIRTYRKKMKSRHKLILVLLLITGVQILFLFLLW